MSVPTNPYRPTTTELVAPPTLRVTENPRVPWTLLLFPLGCTLGLQIGSIVDQGVDATVQRTLTNVQQSLTFFAYFSVACLGLSFLYRIPRWYVLGPHAIGVLTSVASGALMTASFYLVSLVYTGRNPILLFMIAGACIVVAVEFESLIDHLDRHRRMRRSATANALPPSS